MSIEYSIECDLAGVSKTFDRFFKISTLQTKFCLDIPVFGHINPFQSILYMKSKIVDQILAK
jgi:hypothetical protein